MVVGMLTMISTTRHWCNECPPWIFFLPIGHAPMDMHTPLDDSRNSRLSLWRRLVIKLNLKNGVAHFQNSQRKEIGKNILMLECLQVKIEVESFACIFTYPQDCK